MRIIVTFFSLAFLLGVPGHSFAQDPATPPTDFCQENPGFNDWDFWVGEWKVYSNDEARTLLGDNSITKHYENCLIKETWSSAAGGGFSMNYFNPLKSEWRQVWVSNGYAIDYVGGLNEKGQMVLEGEAYDYAANISSPFRGFWTAEENGEVLQRFEIFNADTQVWDVWFEGRYFRQ